MAFDDWTTCNRRFRFELVPVFAQVLADSHPAVHFFALPDFFDRVHSLLQVDALVQVGADDSGEDACDQHGIEVTRLALVEVKQLAVILIILFGVDDLLSDCQSERQLPRRTEVRSAPCRQKHRQHACSKMVSANIYISHHLKRYTLISWVLSSAWQKSSLLLT